MTVAVNHGVTWDQSMPYTEFLETAEDNQSLWEGVYKRAKIPEWAFGVACSRGKGVRLLVIIEDWCGDASNTVPVLAKLGDDAECLEMRVILRDEHPEVMDQYLTNGSRSIPIVIALDADANELGYWGPRPTELQQWVMDNKSKMSKEDLYLQVRKWYARDRGETTLREVLALF